MDHERLIDLRAAVRLALWLSVAAAAASAPAQHGERGPMRSPHGPVRIPCASCHTTTSWSLIRGAPEFNHDRETSYPLRGMHAQVECRSCHTRPVFSETGRKCADCHADIHRRQLGADCESCHNVKGWHAAVASRREHTNRFPLMGGHAGVECESCHRGAGTAQFVGMRTDCYSCHQRAYEQASTLDHRAAGLPPTCESCHGIDTWRAVRFDHARFTGFVLTGSHAALECSSCHKSNQFKGTSADCFSCHRNEFAAATNPDHRTAGFSTQCAACHTTASWQGATFDHRLTRFQLTGAHAQAQCGQCHTGNRFAGTPVECAGCHAQNFQQAANPNHVASGFPQNCQVCHSTAAWRPAAFDHATTRFPLTGAHAATACAQCHTNNRYAGTATQCSGCHLAAFNQTTNPNHVAAGFPQDCSVCHSTAQWRGARFDHSRTKFPLAGAHAPLACERCHSSGAFAGLDAACVSCHAAAYNSAANPNHLTSGFPQQCDVCHSSAAWRPASFDHARTAFALTGAHVRVQCTSCHLSGVYRGTPAECYACHKPQYESVTNPNHRAAGFPTGCAACHNTTTWSGARFDHKFPIYSGAHARRWSTCNECHTNPANYAVFSCTHCHDHSQAVMDPKHREVRGYVFNSANCYTCHPNGRED